ncbi:glycine cleavage system H protein [Bernardetia litoralis DSM 6794]|uniref:Glycine cleavage system H protein n=2 Tax=Bernardetia litoralis TaxID=999 RepID=I4AGP6_BERLS|nr:glycine cleavage system H protein [Bernardetia litoralis DSM 6794]
MDCNSFLFILYLVVESFNQQHKSTIMTFPEELKYTKEHEWIRLEGDIATVGITEFAQSELGDIVYVDITTEGDEVEAGEVFGSVEAVKTVSDLYMPITGTVTEVNPDLEDSPETVNSDPYTGGWMIKIKVNNVADFAELMSAADYTTLVG